MKCMTNNIIAIRIEDLVTKYNNIREIEKVLTFSAQYNVYQFFLNTMFVILYNYYKYSYYYIAEELYIYT